MTTTQRIQSPLPLSLKIAACYLSIVGVAGLLWPLLGLGPYHAEFLSKSTAFKMGSYSREITIGAVFAASGVGLFFRKVWASRMALVVLPIATFYSSFSFAWGYTRGRPSATVLAVSFVIVGLWNAIWFYLIFKKSSRDAITTQPGVAPDAAGAAPGER